MVVHDIEEGNGHSTPRCDGDIHTSEQTVDRMHTEESAGNQRREHHEGSRCDHLTQRRAGRDVDAAFVVGTGLGTCTR